jgi:hypothetical protein
MQSVQYASPGFIRFKLNPMYGDAVAETVTRAVRDDQAIKDAYAAVRAWYLDRAMITTADQTASLKRLVEAVGFVNFTRIESVLETPAHVAAVVSSCTRFIQRLATYVRENKAEFLVDERR